MGRKKYFTEEERKAAHREVNKRYCQKHKDEIAAYKAAHKAAQREYNKQYYQDNKEHIKEHQKQYRQDNKEHIKQYREDNKQYFKQYRQDNKEYIKEHQKQYRQTPVGRANKLLSSYKREDKKHNRGECTITAKWIIENIFTKSCQYCGETDWTKIGCDRIDNDKSHTEDNVVPCCYECNVKRHLKNYEEFKKEMGVA